MAVIEPKPTTVSFIQNKCPPLEAGRYLLTATHSVTAGGNTKTSDTTAQGSGLNCGQYEFYVRGDRFSLTPGVILKVFPPDGAQGEFAGVLPHVVLTRDSLPWERDLSKSTQKALANDDKAPWLAVFVFDSDDPSTPKIQTGKVSDLQSTDSILGYVKAATENDLLNWLNEGQGKGGPDKETACRYINVPAAVFNAVAPSVEDMSWLAHVRHVAFDDNSKAIEWLARQPRAELADEQSNNSTSQRDVSTSE